MRGECYSTKEMEGERKGTRSRTIYDSIKREKMERNLLKKSYQYTTKEPVFRLGKI